MVLLVTGRTLSHQEAKQVFLVCEACKINSEKQMPHFIFTSQHLPRHQLGNSVLLRNAQKLLPPRNTLGNSILDLLGKVPPQFRRPLFPRGKHSVFFIAKSVKRRRQRHMKIVQHSEIDAF